MHIKKCVDINIMNAVLRREIYQFYNMLPKNLNAVQRINSYDYLYKYDSRPEKINKKGEHLPKKRQLKTE